MSSHAQSAPRFDSYVAGLSNGLESYPEARVRSDVLHPIREALEGHVVPDALRAAFVDRSDERWHAEVVGVGLMLLCRDWVFESDEAFLDWGYPSSLALFQSPLNRMLMMVVSPTLVSMNAPKRWANFHQGSELTSDGVNKDGDLHVVHGRLTYPAGVFPELIVQRWGRSILAALEQTRARAPKLEFTAYEPTMARFRASWS